MHIEPQRLDAALQDFARQSGVQIAFFSSITEGLQAPALHGRYTLTQAMDGLLAGTPLTFRVINSQTIQVRMLSGEAQARARGAEASNNQVVESSAQKSQARSGRSDSLEQVVVTGVAEQLVATRIATPLSEIPQTISIISREQMRQQNVTDLADALANAPGITMVRTDSIDRQFFSRAYQITSFHVDGGAALNPRINSEVLFGGSPDISEFDHVEVLRGSDALFGGNGDPGGTVSLVRKRPQKSYELALNASGGSWKTRRAEVDVTGPLTSGGALTGRMDALYSHKNNFYDIANLERKRAFGVLEYDFSSGAALTAGGSYQWDDAVPFLAGLPLYKDGSDSRLPRDTALTFDWAYQRMRLSETYLQYRQELGDQWALKMNASRWRATLDYTKGGFGSAIDPISNAVDTRPFASGTGRPNVHTQTTFDATLAGVLDWFGWREEVAIGGDYTRLHAGLDLMDLILTGPAVTDVRHFDPRLYPNPRANPQRSISFDGTSTTQQYGFFGSLRVYFDDAWSLVGGARIGSDSIDTRITLRGGGISLPLSARFGNMHVVTPYGGIMYDVGKHYSLYASYADIYKTVGTALRRDGRLIGAASGVNLEAGIKGTWRDGALNGSLVMYRIRQSNLPQRDPERPPPGASSSYCCFVTGESRSKGADLEISGELADHWLVGAGYTHNVSESPLGGVLSRETPRHLLKAWTSKQLPGDLSRWTVGGSLLSQTKITTRDTYCGPAGNACSTFDVIQGAVAVLDLRASYEIDTNWQVALNLDNVFDKNYYETLAPLRVWYGEPRNFTLRVDGRF